MVFFSIFFSNNTITLFDEPGALPGPRPRFGDGAFGIDPSGSERNGIFLRIPGVSKEFAENFNKKKNLKI